VLFLKGVFTMPIHFTLNPQKAVESLLWIIQRGEGNVYNAMKILFAADKYHLNHYAAPVTGDRYVAMKYGTVPIWIYNETKRGGHGFVRDGVSLRALPGRTFNRGLFSESDIEALEHGYNEYAGKPFKEVVLKNHREKAWINAIERTPEAAISDILFEDMIIGKQWLVDDLLETGHLTKI